MNFFLYIWIGVFSYWYTTSDMSISYRGWIHLTGYLLAEAVLTSTYNLCFEQKYKKNIKFLSEKFQGFLGEIFYIFE